MAATTTAPLDPLTETNAIVGRIVLLMKQQVQVSETYFRKTDMLSSQVRDALDAVEELRAQLRTKDEIISELQALVAGKVSK